VTPTLASLEHINRRRTFGGGDEAYRDHVFAYVQKEDTPRPLLFQLDLLRQAGFAQVEVLHKNVCFAAFGAVRG
jgi:tRNA (cmo5U34)-methyltransferase